MASAVSAIKKIPWKRVWVASLWLFSEGRARLEKNLSPGERSELSELIKRSKGLPTNLTPRQRDRFRELVGRGIRGA